ncbi:MAG: lysine biosynthesis protein LysX [Candidatus Nezhaarchaeota archaeon]|nr:lysine biosynthesis protein LysX [Candidatus Nezhaarchaeota archaeon]MCX8141504.1 lysine biosynthesis protein LysX [Candidatus Nezhaarchaeota archaeon]MDW8049771.1 lysine biosynthesis protein LysX [Nitrososphaerota archaeon]
MVKVIVLYDRIRAEEKAIHRAGEKLGVSMDFVDIKDSFMDITSYNVNSKILKGDVAIQRCVGHYRALYLTAIMESVGVPVINSFQTMLICGDKLLTTLMLNKAGVPTPKTYVAFTREGALNALNEVGYPAVFKPVVGSWGRLVSLVKDLESAKVVIEHRELLYPLYQVFYIQEYVDKPGRDIRCFVVGDEVITAIYRYAAPGEWRSNTALGGRAVKMEITDELREVSLKAAKAVKAHVVGVDCLESKRGLLVHELNSVTEFRNAAAVTGVDIAGKIVEYAVKLAKR